MTKALLKKRNKIQSNGGGPEELIGMDILVKILNLSMTQALNHDILQRQHDNHNNNQQPFIKKYAILGKISQIVSRHITRADASKDVLQGESTITDIQVDDILVESIVIKNTGNSLENFNDDYLPIQPINKDNFNFDFVYGNKHTVKNNDTRVRKLVKDVGYEKWRLENNITILDASTHDQLVQINAELKEINNTNPVSIMPCKLVSELFKIKFPKNFESELISILNNPGVWASVEMNLIQAIGHIVCMNRILYWYMQSVEPNQNKEYLENFVARFVKYLSLRRSLFPDSHFHNHYFQHNSILPEEIFAYGDKIQKQLLTRQQTSIPSSVDFIQFIFNSAQFTNFQWLTTHTATKWSLIFKYIECLSKIVTEKEKDVKKIRERVYMTKHLSIFDEIYKIYKIYKIDEIDKIDIASLKTFILKQIQEQEPQATGNNDNTVSPVVLAGWYQSFFLCVT